MWHSIKIFGENDLLRANLWQRFRPNGRNYPQTDFIISIT